MWSPAMGLDRDGEVTRADVAAVLAAVLDRLETAGLRPELLVGETPIADAVAAA